MRVILLAVHLLCMNVASAAPLLCIWLVARGNRQRCDKSIRVAKQLALSSVSLLLIGVILGLVLGALSVADGDRRLLETLPFFKKKIFWGVLELLCSVLWILAYWGWLHWWPPRKWIGKFAHAGLAMLSVTNLLYHFPGLLTVMSKVAHGDFHVTTPLDAAGFRELMFVPDVIAHAVHFSVASVAVSGLFLTWLVRNDPQRQSLDKVGARFALTATALQLPVGLWLLVVTPAAPQGRLLGGDPWTTVWFVLSMLSVFYMLQNLAALAYGDSDTRLAARCRWLMLFTVLLMSLTLHGSRG